MTTPRVNRTLKSRPRIIASAISVIVNSSKHSKDAVCAMPSATGSIGSSPLTRPFLSACRWRKIAACTSAMKAWKCTRRFLPTSAASKNMSISMDLPRPTPPPDVEPLGRLALRFRAEQPAERRRLAGRHVAGKMARQRIQAIDDPLLRRVPLDMGGGNRGFVLVADRHRCRLISVGSCALFRFCPQAQGDRKPTRRPLGTISSLRPALI